MEPKSWGNIIKQAIQKEVINFAPSIQVLELKRLLQQLTLKTQGLEMWVRGGVSDFYDKLIELRSQILLALGQMQQQMNVINESTLARTNNPQRIPPISPPSSLSGYGRGEKNTTPHTACFSENDVPLQAAHGPRYLPPAPHISVSHSHGPPQGGPLGGGVASEKLGQNLRRIHGEKHQFSRHDLNIQESRNTPFLGR